MAFKVIALLAFAGVITVFAVKNDPVKKVPEIVSRDDACDETCATICGSGICDESHCYCLAPTERNVTLPKTDNCDINCVDECATYGLRCVGISCRCHGVEFKNYNY